MITVAYDPQIFLMQKRGGISRYFVELIKAFQQNPEIGINPVLINSKVMNEYALSDLQKLGAIDGSGMLQPWRELLLSLTKPATKQDWDIVHHTFYLGPFLLKYGKVKRISTLHDMIPELERPKRLLPNEHFQKERYLERSDAIISVSTSTLSMAKEYYPFDIESKSTVVHHGISNNFMGTQEVTITREGRYILFVGNRGGYKQGTLLIEALSLLTGLYDLNLLFVGGGKFSESELDFISKLNLDKRVSQEEANDRELKEIYRQAQVFVMPSLYEGFGMPVLEAMAARCPVLLSNTSSLPEVAGEAARYFTPGDVNSLANEIHKIILEDNVRPSMAEAGSQQVLNFSWAKCAQETAYAYRKTLGLTK
jgi:glycosyltransferase involved in cell wall biosynthesis